MFGILVKQFTNCRLGMMSWGLTLMIAAAQRSGLSNAMFVEVVNKSVENSLSGSLTFDIMQPVSLGQIAVPLARPLW